MSAKYSINDFLSLLGRTHAFLKGSVVDGKKDPTLFKDDEEREATIRVLDILFKLLQYKKDPKKKELAENYIIVVKELSIADDSYVELCAKLAKKKENPFKGFLPEDLVDFVFKKNSENSKHAFWGSFWKTCAGMLSDGMDLTDRQLVYVYQEYNKVKDERMLSFLEDFKKGKDEG
jgi:hypothetical protein